jgi:hypothetical protein
MRFALAFLLLMLAGCSLPLGDQARVEQSLRAYEQVRDGDVEGLKAQSAPSLQPQLTPSAFEGLRSYTVKGSPEETKVLSWKSTQVRNGEAYYELVQQLEYDQATVLLSTVMVRSEGRWQIAGLRLNVVDPAVARAAGAFTFENKSPGHFGVLAAAILAPILCLVTFAVALWRRRWGWMIGSLFGFGQLALNWNTGEWTVQIAHFALFSAGFLKGAGPFDPWVLMVSLPIPAILFWALRRDRPKPGKPGKQPVASALSLSDDEPL